MSAENAKLLSQHHLVMVASMRQQVLTDTIRSEVVSIDDALKYCGVSNHLQQQHAMYTQLRSDNIIVADTENHAIRKIVLHEGEGDGMVTTLAGGVNEGFADGPAPTAQFNGPTGVECDQHGNIFVVDTGNHAIRKIAANGIVSTFAGSGMP